MLWDSWREYAHARGAEPGSPAEFAAAMERLGFECDRLPGERHRIRWGIRLLQPPQSRQPQGGGQKSAAAQAPAPPPLSFGDFFREESEFLAAVEAALAAERRLATGMLATSKLEAEAAPRTSGLTERLLGALRVAVSGVEIRAAAQINFFRGA